MKVGIVTWISYYNFGTFLQAYALQYTLKNHNVDPYFIDDVRLVLRYRKSINALTRSMPLWMYSTILKVKSYIEKDSHRTRFRNEIINKFERFRNLYLPMAPKNMKFDTYIAGSDQIWAPQHPLDSKYHRHYFLGNISGKKIAYAPSMRVSPDDKERFSQMIKKWVCDFSALSAREEMGVKFLETITSKKVENVLDPTLLLSKQDWIKGLDLETRQNGRYCLCYLLTYRPDIIKFAREYATQHCMTLRIIATKNIPADTEEGEILVVGPKEFLELILNSSLVVTDSFHASVFSAIFEKPRVIYQRFTTGLEVLQNNRISNLLNLMESNGKCVYPGNEFTENDIIQDSFDTASFRVAKKRSLGYLEKSLRQ